MPDDLDMPKELEAAILRFLETTAAEGYQPQAVTVDASMVAPNPMATIADTSPDPNKSNTLGSLASQAGSTSIAVIRNLAPYGLQMAVSAAAYSMGLGLFQVLGYGLRVSCNTRFLSSCLGFMGVGFSSAFAGHMTRHVQRQLDHGGPMALLRVPPWADLDPEEALLDAVVGVSFFKVCRGEFRKVMPSNVTQPGAFAEHSLPIAGDFATTGERYATPDGKNHLVGMLRKYGCHHCGDRGVRPDKVIGDHMPPTALHKATIQARAPSNAPPFMQQVLGQARSWFLGEGVHHGQRQRLYPQCQKCSNYQGVHLRHGKTTPLIMHWRIWRLPSPGVVPGIVTALRPVKLTDLTGPPAPPTGPGSRGKQAQKQQQQQAVVKASKGWWWASMAPSLLEGDVAAVRGGQTSSMALSPIRTRNPEVQRAPWGGTSQAGCTESEGPEEGEGRPEESEGIWAWARRMDEAATWSPLAVCQSKQATPLASTHRRGMDSACVVHVSNTSHGDGTPCSTSHDQQAVHNDYFGFNFGGHHVYMHTQQQASSVALASSTVIDHQHTGWRERATHTSTGASWQQQQADWQQSQHADERERVVYGGDGLEVKGSRAGWGEQYYSDHYLQHNQGADSQQPSHAPSHQAPLYHHATYHAPATYQHAADVNGGKEYNQQQQQSHQHMYPQVSHSQQQQQRMQAGAVHGSSKRHRYTSSAATDELNSWAELQYAQHMAQHGEPQHAQHMAQHGEPQHAQHVQHMAYQGEAQHAQHVGLGAGRYEEAGSARRPAYGPSKPWGTPDYPVPQRGYDHALQHQQQQNQHQYHQGVGAARGDPQGMSAARGATWASGLDLALRAAARAVGTRAAGAVDSPPASWPLALHAS